MNSRDVRRWMVRLGLLGLAGAFTLGCPERADEITESATEPSFDFAVSTNFATPSAPFAIRNVTLAQIDTAVTDAFGRTASFLTPAASFFTCGGDCPAWEFPVRNGSEDTRLPDLGDDDATAQVGITPDSIFGDPFLVRVAGGLQPNTQYTWALERLALTVNEGLDHSNALLDSPEFAPFISITNPDAPDQLTRLGGSPGTALGDNPYIISTSTSDVNGAIPFGAPAFTGTGNSDIIETNSLESFDLPFYNYLVLYEGPDASGTPVMRAQVGVDLDVNGDPINNSLAPFPTAPLTRSQMLAGPGGAGRPDSVAVTFNRLEELAGGAQYTAWLLNENTGDMIPATGTYNLIAIVADRDPISGEILSTSDSLGETTANVGGFAGGFVEGDRVVGFRHQIVLSDASLGTDPEDVVGFYTHLILSLDDNPGDGQPSASTPFWFQYTNQSETPNNFFDDSFNNSGNSTFGNIDLTAPSDTRVYNGSGFGIGGFRENEMSVDLEALSRPPVGYQLVGWLIPDDGSAPFRLPDITGPPPARASLVDADVSTEADVVTENGILDANFRVFEGEAGISFPNFSTFVVTLEPKAGVAGMGPVQVYIGSVPDHIAEQDEGE